jgi:hypothetical protein
MPTPQVNETQSHYIERCMAYPDMQKYDPAQRRAICQSMWDRRKDASDGKTIKITKNTSISTNRVYGDSIGQLGFPMPGDIARAVDDIIKDIPQECKDMLAAANGPCRMWKAVSKMDFVDGERADISLITTESLDRDKDVMLAVGMDWTQWKRNPVVTFAHDYQSLPIGKGMWVKRVKSDDPNTSGWLGKTRYTTKPPDWNAPWLPDAIWHLVRSGDLPGKSLGFIPMEVRKPDQKEIAARPEIAKAQHIISKCMVLEWAVAPIQSNPDALVQHIAKMRADGIDPTQRLLEQLGLIVPCDASIAEIDWKAVIVDDDDDLPDPGIISLLPSSKDIKIIIQSELQKCIGALDVPKIVAETLEQLRGKV